ncbi:MAG TPA: hypothetical protein IAD39_01410 [Candidatus Merdisoma faecalis]|nr:hypothetical protein [Candidatus Merdisoma faecalis]
MYTLSLLLLALFSLYIGIFAFWRWDASWLRELDTVPAKILFVLVFALLLCAALLLIRRLLARFSEKNLKRTAFLCIFLLAAGQLLFLGLIQPQLRYDPLKVFDMAVEMLRTHTISGTYETGYFARYTNNYPLTILTYWFLLLLSRLSVPESWFMPAVQLVNVGCITLSIWLGYLIAKELKGRLFAVFYLAVCVLCPLSYVWAGYFYTATCSMPCLMGILYLYLRLRRSRAGKNTRDSADSKESAGSEKPAGRRRIFLCALLGVVSILGFKLRATAAIALIAVALDALLRFWRQKKQNGCFLSSALVLKAKTWLLPGAAFLLTAALTLGLFSAAVNRYVDFDYKNTGFPTVHWVMMGARWDGSFDQNDEFYTSSFETKEEKTAADLKVLKERIAEAGPLGLVSLAGRKLLNTWVDGTDSYLAENSYARYSKVYDYLIGDKSGFLTLYSQAFRALNMLAMGLCALLAFVRLKRHKEYPPLFLIQLTVLGCMAFHLIWETNPLYSISFTFLCLILLADGISSLRESPAMILVLKKSWIGCAAGFALLAALLFLGKKELVDTPIEAWDYSVNQYQYAGGYDGYVTSYDQTYVQTFTTDKPFNRVSIQVINPVGPYNQSAFTVRITDENGNVIYDNDRFLSGLVDQLENSYEFVLDEIVPDGPTAYTLEITPGYIEGENSLEFLSYNTGNWDLYADGSLTSAGQEEEKGDLAFAVYEYEVTTYFSLKQYAVLCAGMLLLAAALTVGTRQMFRGPRSVSRTQISC